MFDAKKRVYAAGEMDEVKDVSSGIFRRKGLLGTFKGSAKAKGVGIQGGERVSKETKSFGSTLV